MAKIQNVPLVQLERYRVDGNKHVVAKKDACTVGSVIPRWTKRKAKIGIGSKEAEG